MRSSKKWTAEEIKLLRRLYPYNLTKDIAHHFDVSPKAVAHKAFLCGIRKTREIRALCRKDGQFRKGESPFNKGKKWDQYMSEDGKRKAAMTQFKPSHIPYNIRPDYTSA